jgi:hypothetical protein
LSPELLGFTSPGLAVYGYGYVEATTDTTQQSGQTPIKEVEFKNITVYVSGYTETRTDTKQQSGQTPDKEV